MIVTRVVSWEDVLEYRRGWNNLVWFATLITLADGLGRVGFLPWFATKVASAVGGFPVTVKIVLIVVVFFVAHYMFASLTAHTTALLPVLLTAIVVIPDLPITVVALCLSYTLGLMGIITPYATGSAPLYYGSGYISHRDFWTLGLVCCTAERSSQAASRRHPRRSSLRSAADTRGGTAPRWTKSHMMRFVADHPGSPA